MQTQRTVGQIQLVIKQHLVEGRRIAQVLLLQGLGIGIQRLVALNRVAAVITLGQVIAQAPARDHLAHLLLQRGRIGLEVLQYCHDGSRIEAGLELCLNLQRYDP